MCRRKYWGTTTKYLNKILLYLTIMAKADDDGEMWVNSPKRRDAIFILFAETSVHCFKRPIVLL